MTAQDCLPSWKPDMALPVATLRQGIYQEISPKNFDHVFDGRVVLVTGSSRGIGKSIALAFAQSGAAVAITGRNRNEVESATQEVLALGKHMKAVGVVADGCKTSDLERLITNVGDLSLQRTFPKLIVLYAGDRISR
jgi:NAD(P)-dependent dehydrogenase (short-subunit alcohol dehydrogenase family)